MILAHKIQLRPTNTQEAYFRRACDTARFVWNWALAEWNAQYAAGEKPKAKDLKRRLNRIKRDEFPWMLDVHRDCSSQPFANLQQAFNYFFKKKSKHPRFHKKGRRDSFYLANDKFQINERRVRIPRLGWVKMTEALRFVGKIVSATVSRTADRWFISISVDVGAGAKTKLGANVIGVDLGVKHAAVLSDGRKFDGPKPLKAALRRLQRRSRQHSRKQKGSNNRRKSTVRLARLYWRIANQRRDFLHKLTTGLCRTADVIVIEDLGVAGMLKNHYLARAIADVGFGEFRRQLEYKTELTGTRLGVAPRFYPSTKRCSSCGAVKKQMDLSEREYECEACGVVEDRDFNAAENLKQLGAASPEVTPVDMEALAQRNRVKPPCAKQEFQDVSCASGK